MSKSSKPVGIRLQNETINLLDLMSRETGTPRSELVRNAVEQVYGDKHSQALVA